MSSINYIPNNIIGEILLSGVLFQYESYDHKMAIQYMMLGGIIPHHLSSPQSHPHHSYTFIPPEVKQKHMVLRIGKIRSIDFNPNGEIKKFRIGNKRAKNFYPSDFSVTVKPILHKCLDKHHLVSNGLAIEKELI